jgi:hypothetical protein
MPPRTPMASTSNTPKNLDPGVYWYLVPGKAPAICEKRVGEDFVRFTNGAHQSWAREGERFDGPLVPPAL